MPNAPAISVSGRRWDSTRATCFAAPEGLSLEHIVSSSIERAYRERVYSWAQHRALMRYARCRVDGLEIARERWGSLYPRAGARVEILHGVRGGGGGGGGGGKNPLVTVLSVVVMAVAAIATWGVGGVAGWSVFGMVGTLGLGPTAGAIAGGLVMIGGMMLVNALFPTPSPKGVGGGNNRADPEKISPTYSLSGGRNAANVNGYVPLICGRHRFTPPLGGRSWTRWEGEKQYFHMLVVWGHPDISVSDFRIGDTPLGNFKDVQHAFHQSGVGDDMRWFGQSYNEQQVGATLKQTEGWNTRAIGECQAISLDFSFSRGLVTIDQNTGGRNKCTVRLQVQYKRENEATWHGLGNSDGVHDFSAATQKPQVRSVFVDGLPRAIYEVRCRRVSADTDDSYILDECQWSVMRAILHQPAFKTDIPLCYSELRIRASEQLSGYVDDFNAICHSRLPDWNGTAWVAKNTSNPASIMRYMLTSRHCLAKPYSIARLDNAKLVELWKYCNTNGHEFNFVCDSETALWERLVQVLAPGRAAPTTDVDGLWGVVIDREGKTPVQLFTPRNSWGLRVQRGFAAVPQALRVSFRDEAHDYEERHAYVYNDGFSADGKNGTSKADDVIEWDFPGITNWQKIWKQGRMYMARALHRQMTVTLSTDWEWMVCHRGDLVGVASDVLMNTFGAARIIALVYQVSGGEVVVFREEDTPSGGSLVGIRLDDTLHFSEPYPARYGIAVRTATGAVTTWELRPEYGEEREILYFLHPPATQMGLHLGALVSVSLLGEEYAEYLVANLSPQDNNACEITLIPYKIDEINAAMSGAIPPYEESVILDQIKARSLPAPLITRLRSDEAVLGGVTGASIPRIAVWWSLPPMRYTAADLVMQIQAMDVETGEVFWGTASGDAAYIWVEGVKERRVYDVRLRAVTRSGIASSWSAAIRHVCIGRTTPPPPPTQVLLDGSTLRITQGNRPQDVIGHVVSMVFDADDPFEWARRLSNLHTTDGLFDIAPWAGYARRVFVQAVDEIGLLSTPVSVLINTLDREIGNVIFSISQRDDAQWAGDIVNGRIQGNVLRADERGMLWAADNDTALWQPPQPPNDALPLWPIGDALPLVYVYKVTVPGAYAGAHVRVETVPLSGRLQMVEYRVGISPPLWSDDNAIALWKQDDAVELWPMPVFGEWMPFPSDYTATGWEVILFRLTWAGGNDPAALADVLTVFDVPDKEWAVEDLSLSNQGANVPIPPNWFRAITNVVATLQYRQGDTGVTVARVPASEIMGDNGFLTAGPVLFVLDAVRQKTAASVDVRLKGY